MIKLLSFLSFISILLACNNVQVEPDKRSQNEKSFDSLVSIIKSDKEFAQLIANEAQVSDSIKISMNEILNTNYKTLIKKHELDSSAEKELLNALSISAKIIETKKKMDAMFNSTQKKLEKLNQETQELLDSKLEYDSIKPMKFN